MPNHREPSDTDDVAGFMDRPRLEPEAEELLIEPAKRAGARKRHEGSTLIKTGIGIGLLTAVLVLVAVAGDQRADRNEQEIARNNERIDALYTVGKQWEAAARSAGVPSAAPPVDEVAEDPGIVDSPQQAPPQTGQPGPEGPRGPGPTASEVAQAVAAYCQVRDGCRGPQGTVGPAISPAQVATAVSTYCDAKGQCQGPTGKPGAEGQDGKDGADSTVPGPQGPGPTTDQIFAAVEAFCADNIQCTGPKGDKGEPGKDSTVPGPQGTEGPPGQKGDVGPAPESWTFTFLGQQYQCADKDGDLAYDCVPI